MDDRDDDSFHHDLKHHYVKNKKSIRQRLREFEQYGKRAHHWIVKDGRLVLQRSDKDLNVSLFEELVFCILAANTSSKMATKSLSAIRPLLLSGSEKEISSKLKGIYRFPNIRASFIVHTREYLKKNFFLDLDSLIKDILNDSSSERRSSILGYIKKTRLAIRARIFGENNYFNKQLLREFFACNKEIKGIGMKEASHFLRNIGFSDYCILDKHIIKSLFELGVISINRPPKSKQEYLEMENAMKAYAKSIGIDINELDLLLWSRKNGEVLK